jgi:paraquat-inducible protein B
MHDMVVRLDSKVEPLTSSIKQTSDEATVTLKKAQVTMAGVDGLVGEQSAIAYQLPKTLAELEAASRSIKYLADELNRRPESLIWGKK